LQAATDKVEKLITTWLRNPTAAAPWTVIKSNDKRRCRVEAIRYVLSCLPYAGRDERAAGRPDPLIARRRDTS
jgi:hypothetical protein